MIVNHKLTLNPAMKTKRQSVLVETVETVSMVEALRNAPLKRGVNVNRTSPRSRGGFTLVELLLVLVILGILAAIVIPRFAGRSEQAKEQAAVTQISSLTTALNNFEVDNGYYPKSLGDLLVQPRDAQN